MSLSRKCSRTACPHAAIATLTYVYADSTVVLGPLATYAEPHTYDLCVQHAERLTAPRGWDVVRLAGVPDDVPTPGDDLFALADAVREPRDRPAPARPAGRGPEGQGPRLTAEEGMRREADSGAMEVARRGHLRVLRDH